MHDGDNKKKMTIDALPKKRNSKKMTDIFPETFPSSGF